MKYILDMNSNGGDAKDFFSKAISELHLIEVKGDSVEHLYIARMLFSQIYNSMKELPEEVEK